MKPQDNKPERSKKAPLFALVAVIAMAFVMGQCATQYVAAELNYHPALGQPVVGHIYLPWQFFIWQFQFYQYAQQTFQYGYLMFVVGVGLVFVIYALMFGFMFRNNKRNDGVHGTAHWATRDEIINSGLLPPDSGKSAGVYLGAWHDKKSGKIHYLRHNGPEHLIAIAPTRSGKGVGPVLTTLLSEPESMVINDIKGELWGLTSGWRKHHANNYVFRFEPTTPDVSCKFNPLEEIRLVTLYEVGDAQNLATIIVDPEGKGLEDHWAKTSHAFITGLMLFKLYEAREQGAIACMYDIMLAMSDPEEVAEVLYGKMLTNNFGKDGAPHPIIAGGGRDMLNTPEEERGSVLSTARSFLSLYRDPIVAENTSRSDFHIMDLMNADKPVSLYIIPPPSEKDRIQPLTRLMVNQITRVLSRPPLKLVNGRSVSPHRWKLLQLVDEFPSLGKLPLIEENLAYLAGWGIKFFLFTQGLPQIINKYGKDNEILLNTHIRLAYAPNDNETANWLSDQTGTMTVVKEDISTSGKRFGGFLSNVTRNFSQHGRKLLTPDECLTLPGPKKNADQTLILEPGALLVIVAGHAPIYAEQILYFKDPVFLKRSQIPTAWTDTIDDIYGNNREGFNKVEEFQI
ncbi:type IV secretory system conjugative DNA transfer family protein [Erwinia pyrifoliae]|uniref:type IV secretory system conjugative DNA transfer family protein n=1 Tax=Erwinia pyrifoliae TaxID=79967 RepID=UPI00223A9334|nr:type IV secretory system conjugative DNA transfer family protein [Erwinia pyrifoliae]MCT2388877.1 type IV secretory system conjugative DNA transfer family protein [Erwinia pyrifoliae]MCU8589071.1 type IV secretory system conjugative DNA transfer family protein [Erwinia pyrifoliae]